MSIETHLRLIGDEPTDIVITISTDARMRKKDNPFSNVIKVQTLRCSVNFDYERVMSKEHGSWVVENRKWGKHVEGTCLIEHKGQRYVQVHVLEIGDPMYAHDGKRIPAELLLPYLYPSSESAVRDIKVSNIASLGINGKVKVDRVEQVSA